MKVEVTLTCEVLGSKEAVEKGLRYCGLSGQQIEQDGSHVFKLVKDKVSTIDEAIHAAKTQLGYSADADPVQGAIYRLQDCSVSILEA